MVNIKRNPAEQAAFDAILRVQGKKDNLSLADVTARLAARNFEFARYLISRGIEVGDYYSKVVPIKKQEKKR
jgi:hypothetical protein